jgi:hypothetical protein
MIEHAVGRQAPHLYQPVDRGRIFRAGIQHQTSIRELH